MNNTKCQICGSESTIKLFEFNATQHIYACNNCGVEFLTPQLNDDELTKLYSENYYLAWGLKGKTENESIKRMKISTFQMRLNLIKQFVNSGRILDVGCATGYFLEAAKSNGFHPFGVELSAYSAQLAQSKFGEAAVFNGILEQAPFAEKSFSVIAMSDLIEHVRYPIITLKKAHQLLEDKGVLMIMTPNTDSPSHKRMKEKWTHYKLEHFYYFNKASITKAAKKAGFEVLHYEHAKKSMNIDYFHTQLNVYKNKFVTPVINVMYKLLPTWAVQKIFNIKLGEMVVILKKQS